MEDSVLASFQKGDPAEAWRATQRVLRVTRSLAGEVAQLRFELTFGTNACSNCEGLKAGEGVVATCFQLRKCYYRNTKSSDMSPKQAAVVQALVQQDDVES